MIDKSELKPIKIDDLIRLGRDNDGGYIIPKIILVKRKIQLELIIGN